VNKLIFIPVLVLLDFFSKLFFKSGSVLNTGVAFGLFQENNVLWMIVSLVVVLLLCYWYYKEKKYRLGLMLVISGAVGNLLDRVLYGGVVDFINLSIWPAFNFADAYNVGGVVVIIYFMYRK